jgi:hypothetical protein
VAALRQAAGLPGEPAAAGSPEPEASPVDATPPDWFEAEKVRVRIDADELLAQGEVPLPRINQAVASLAAGTLLCVKSAFRPAPLLEALHKAGHRTYVTQTSSDAFHTYVCPRGSP